jgi:TonB family protein
MIFISNVFPLRIFLAVVICTGLLGTTVAKAQSLDELATQLAKETKKAKLKSVAVIDFLGADGYRLDLGWYLASKLSADLLKRDKRGFDRDRLQDFKASAVDPTSKEDIKRIGSAWGVDVIVSGSVEITPEQYLVSTTLRRSADGSVVATLSKGLPHSRILDLLSPAGTESDTEKPMRAGVKGVGVPQCLQCPVPVYTAAATQAGVQSARVVLEVTISARGIPTQIKVVRALGYGLTERAVEALSHWKLRPAPGPNGPSVPVIVPIEVDFRPSARAKIA